MTANIRPLFPKVGDAFGEVSIQNSNLNGTGGFSDFFPGGLGVSGEFCDYIRVKAEQTTTPGMIRIFLELGGPSYLWKEIPVSAVTPSATVKSFEAERVPTKPLVLPNGSGARSTTEQNETMVVYGFGGEY